MILSQRLPHRILPSSSSSSSSAFLGFSNTISSICGRRLTVRGGRPLVLPLVTTSASTVAVEPEVDVSFSEQNAVSDDEELRFAAQTPEFEQAPIRLPLQKLFVPPEVDLIGGVGSARVLKGSNIVLGPYAKGELVSTAEFVKSSTKTEDCPSDGLPEFSSLLNSIVRRKRLALTSKKPGKTQCINHFRINDSWYLVDLPGYGYASAPQQLRTDWDKFTKDYFLKRQTLVSVFLLIDASIPPKKTDLQYACWLGQNQVPMTILFTKCDKRKKAKNGGKRPEENFFQTAPPWILTSSVTNQGRDEILLHMGQLRNYWLKR
ncbi:unnamed protein product [Spirodela intermedia]|uniref:EngB-type G domain-containing protein n=1 Tax=Spirodela intermedia TaxID=51605 RepID=A0A7I8IT07_SPIIN|nr:unnamed protein product [Spirodela intermedia]CAA6661013.1 unnamed protein product [Spirodela intermedia]